MIGIGGFGIVYKVCVSRCAVGQATLSPVHQGLNLENGMTVAVKRFGIMGTPSEEVKSIEVHFTDAMSRLTPLLPALPSERNFAAQEPVPPEHRQVLRLSPRRKVPRHCHRVSVKAHVCVEQCTLDF